ncbi:hypothetical protein FRC03_006980, partial [Tulasnella sp. 419]
GVLYDVVNGLWIVSLVLSVASAIHSQLVYQWRAAMYRSPTHTLPWLVTAWLTKTPLLFLVFSALLFSAGLVTWTYASEQKLAVSISTTCIAFIALLALPATLLMWTAFEYWRYTNPAVIEQELSDDEEGDGEESGVAESMSEKAQGIRSTVLQACSRIFNVLKKEMHGSSRSASDLEQGGVTREGPQDLGQDREPEYPSSNRHPAAASPVGTGNEPHLMTDAGQFTMDPDEEQQRPDNEPEGFILVENPNLAFPEPYSPKSPGLMSTIMPLASDIGGFNSAPIPRNVDSSTSAPQNSSFRRSYWASSDRRSYFKRHNTSYDDNVDLHQLAKITSTLRKFSASLLLSDQHKSSICHLQFSPDGYYLASGSSDHSASIWKLEGELGGIHYTFHDKLEHKGQGESVQQVAWSPAECRLLTRSSNIIHVWTAE